MGLRMENFNIFGVHWKIGFLGGGEGGGSWKTNIEGGLPKKVRLGQFADLREDLARKRGWCFWVEMIPPMHTLSRRTEKCVPHKQNMRKYTMIVLSISKISWNYMGISSNWKTQIIFCQMLVAYVSKLWFP